MEKQWIERAALSRYLLEHGIGRKDAYHRAALSVEIGESHVRILWDAAVGERRMEACPAMQAEYPLDDFELDSPVFVNVSNHPSERWSEAQSSLAQRMGQWSDGEEYYETAEIVDIPHPPIPPTFGVDEVKDIVENVFHQIVSRVPPQYMEHTGLYGSSVVHVMGESGFTFLLVSRLISEGYKVVHSTTERKVVEKDGKKTSEFRFVNFRGYA